MSQVEQCPARVRRQILAALLTLVAAFASLATSEPCDRTLSTEGTSRFTQTAASTAQRFRVIAGPLPSLITVKLELHSSAGASVRAALVPDEPDLFEADGGMVTRVEVLLTQTSSEPVRGEISLPECRGARCANHAVRLDLDSQNAVAAEVRWTVTAAINECKSEEEADYFELRRE